MAGSLDKNGVDGLRWKKDREALGEILRHIAQDFRSGGLGLLPSYRLTPVLMVACAKATRRRCRYLILKAVGI